MEKRSKKAKKGKDSDEEVEDEVQPAEGRQVAVKEQPSRAAVIAEELRNVPAIPQSEVSPAAFIFQQIEDKDDLNLYEEK